MWLGMGVAWTWLGKGVCECGWGRDLGGCSGEI